jgi:hypothetical protein
MKKELKFVKATRQEALEKGYKVYQHCPHYLVDMSHLSPKTEDWMNTISIKLPNDRFVTLCVIQASETQTCVDIDYHARESKTDKVWAMKFEDGTGETIKGNGLYTVIIDNV